VKVWLDSRNKAMPSLIAVGRKRIAGGFEMRLDSLMRIGQT
jgi:hypothetical protein